MTTYELPPEPPVGSRVRDASGREWVSDANVGWKSGDESRVMVVGWALLMDYHGPLTLIEPDPWPTDDLIVATLSSPSRSTKRLLLARNSNGDYVDGVRSALQEIDTLTNVVPVTVVAEWRMVRDAAYIRGSGEGDRDYWARVGKQAVYAVTATDALGVDL